MIFRGSQTVKKASQSSLRQQRKRFKIVFDRGVYVGENTSQAASVEFVRLWRTNYARSRLQNWRKSPKGFFDKLQRRSVFQEIFYVQTIHLFPRAQA